MNALAILKLLDVLLLLSARIPALVGKFRAIHTEIAAMQAEGRVPTDAEWEEVGARIDDRLAKLGGGA